MIWKRHKRLLILCGIFFGIYGFDTWRRWWTPDRTVETEHFTIYSTATERQTEQTGIVAEMLFDAYGRFMAERGLEPIEHGKLKMKLYEDRDELRFSNRIRGWAEAFYRWPYCHQYLSPDDPNPYHWMVHEATHQLSNEVADLDMSRWLEEGIAEYFGTSRITPDGILVGEPDTNTYPIWWMDQIFARTGDLDEDKRNVSVIPLRRIVADSGGPDIDEYFNLYYIHWWTAAHFLMHFEDGRYRPGLSQLMRTGCGIDDFETHIGPLEDVEKEWYRYALELKRNLSGKKTPKVVLVSEP